LPSGRAETEVLTAIIDRKRLIGKSRNEQDRHRGQNGDSLVRHGGAPLRKAFEADCIAGQKAETVPSSYGDEIPSAIKNRHSIRFHGDWDAWAE